MRKIIGIGVTILGGILGSGVAFAGDGGAIVLKDLQHPYGCFLVAGIVTPIPLWTDGTQPGTGIHTVATPSGGVKLTCDFAIPDPAFDPATAQNAHGIPCGVFLPNSGVYTTDTVALSTPGGHAQLQCTLASQPH